jgi:hypothetical protein
MSNLHPLLEKYESNRVIRSLIQLVPFGVGGALDVVLTKTLEKIREDRTATFFDELANGNVIVNEELLKSEDFLHAFFSTTKYALNSRRQEKIKMFARLLKNSATNEDLSKIDEYEDFLEILDELSYRELLGLKILDEYSSTPRTAEQNDLMWANQFWDEFEQRLSSELSISNNQIADFMNRVARTGCYEMFTGTFFDYTGGKGKLTPTYHQLQKYIEAR